MPWVESIIGYLQFWVDKLPLLSGPMRLVVEWLQNLL